MKTPTLEQLEAAKQWFEPEFKSMADMNSDNEDVYNAIIFALTSSAKALEQRLSNEAALIGINTFNSAMGSPITRQRAAFEAMIDQIAKEVEASQKEKK